MLTFRLLVVLVALDMSGNVEMWGLGLYTSISDSIYRYSLPVFYIQWPQVCLHLSILKGFRQGVLVRLCFGPTTAIWQGVGLAQTLVQLSASVAGVWHVA